MSNEVFEIEETVNGYRDAIQKGAAYISQFLPGAVAGELHLDLAIYIFFNEHGALHAAERLEDAAQLLRNAEKQGSRTVQ